jgi:hypothetical protein
VAIGRNAAEALTATALSDRYELDRGRVFMTGVQALVRVLLDQHRADRAAGLSTATFVVELGAVGAVGALLELRVDVHRHLRVGVPDLGHHPLHVEAVG